MNNDTDKATEEGELPEIPASEFGWVPTYFPRKQMQEYARKAIAADRASRQVANKAEVEPAIEFKAIYGEMPPVWRTHPATTGASTVLTDERISAGARWLSNHQADACGVDREDNWKLYGGSIIEEFREACTAAFGTQVAAQAGQVAVPNDVLLDAERYRKIKSDNGQSHDKTFCLFWDEDGNLLPVSSNEMDSEIDTAIAAPSPAKESK